MRPNMSCNEIRDLLVLYAYGELTFDQEENVDAHLTACPACQKQRAAISTLHKTADDAVIEPSFELLSACRQDLRRQVAVIAAASSSQPFWRKWFNSVNAANT